MDVLNLSPDEIDEITTMCNSNFQFHLLFKTKPEKPSTNVMIDALHNRFGEVTVMLDTEELRVYSLEEYAHPFSDGKLKIKLIMSDLFAFDSSEIHPEFIERYGEKELTGGTAQMRYSILITDMLASSLERKRRCEILVGWLKAVLDCFDFVDGVWIPSTRRLLLGSDLKKCSEKEILKALFLGISVQVYFAPELMQYIVLTRGLETLSQKNVAYIFHDINEEVAVEYAYQMASNLLENRQILEAFEDFDKYIVEEENPVMKSSDSLIRIFTI